MATRLKGVDIVIVGLGWTGGILARELGVTGLSIVALERGKPRDTNPDFMMPTIHDELRYARRHELMQNAARHAHLPQQFKRDCAADAPARLIPAR
jgi:gluconate 2-dehydrogenase alpha chain